MKSDKSYPPPVFELKGSVMTVMVLHVTEIDPDLLYPQLIKKIGQGRSFFYNAPIVIDLNGVDEESQSTFDCRFLAETLRNLDLVPVAVRGAAACLQEQILLAGMGLLPVIKGERTTAAPENKQQTQPEQQQTQPEPPQEQTPKPQQEEQTSKTSPSETSGTVSVPTKVITQPVRSGQQVLAPEGDLVILSSVNAGAEVLAAGNIHVYGALRGRAMAGINGDTSACIFSMQCNPELVAVAGEYVVNELLEKNVINSSVMISLFNTGLNFTPISTSNQNKH